MLLPRATKEEFVARNSRRIVLKTCNQGTIHAKKGKFYN